VFAVDRAPGNPQKGNDSRWPIEATTDREAQEFWFHPRTHEPNARRAVDIKSRYEGSGAFLKQDAFGQLASRPGDAQLYGQAGRGAALLTWAKWITFRHLISDHNASCKPLTSITLSIGKRRLNPRYRLGEVASKWFVSPDREFDSRTGQVGRFL
jgi:hypothetical protein